MEKLDGKTFDVINDNIEKIKEIFPEVVTEGKIDFEKLQQTLGENVERSKERYDFTWHGKSEAIQLAQKQTTGTLRPCKEESVNWDSTKNLYIEGDNLEVLKTLQNSYRNKVKVIYIDPPYNTGNDFIYHDDYSNNVKNYNEQLEQQFKSNRESNGRFHTDWLNLMYPRLKIARNLLKEDGVIFISIDDTEYANIKKMCDEIFGEENHISSVVWQRAYAPINLKKYFSQSHDYILVYAKRYGEFKLNKLKRTEDQLKDYKNPDNDPRGAWKAGNPSVGPAVEKNIYEIELLSGRKVWPPNGRSWLYSKEKFHEMVEDNRIYFGRDGDSVWAPKLFLNEVSEGVTPMSLWTYKEVGHSQDATKDLKKLFDGHSYFDYPKPLKLLKRILHISLDSDKEEIVLDFFAGSSSTAHALLEHNYENKTKHSYIMVQLPEMLKESSSAYKNGLLNIAEIGKERIRKARDTFKEDENICMDTGFKVFKLDETNLHIWESKKNNIEENLFDLIDPLKENRTRLDVVYEILLKYGVELTIPIEKRVIGGTEVFDIGLGYLLICLEEDLELDNIEEIAKEKPLRVVFYDEGFKNDTVRTNAQQILQRHGVEDIRVI